MNNHLFKLSGNQQKDQKCLNQINCTMNQDLKKRMMQNNLYKVFKAK